MFSCDLFYFGFAVRVFLSISWMRLCHGRARAESPPPSVLIGVRWAGWVYRLARARCIGVLFPVALFFFYCMSVLFFQDDGTSSLRVESRFNLFWRRFLALIFCVCFLFASLSVFCFCFATLRSPNPKDRKSKSKKHIPHDIYFYAGAHAHIPLFWHLCTTTGLFPLLATSLPPYPPLVTTPTNPPSLLLPKLEAVEL